MTIGAIIGIVVAAIIVVALVAYALYRWRRSNELQDQFGPEYDRTVEDTGSKREAESMLVERRKRVQDLNIVPLSAADRQHFSEQWQIVQGQFVDDPSGAVTHADELVTSVMRSRGYPMSDFDQRADDISVDHPDLVSDYRQAHDISQRNDSGEATTEELRQAMVHYRALFEDLLETPETAEVSS